MEPTSAVLMTYGLATLLVSWVLLLIAAWRDDYAWGMFAVFLPPIAYIYGAGQSILVAAAGWIMLLMAF